MSTARKEACLAAHADWSISPHKRWMALAAPQDSSWRVRIEKVGPVETLLARLRREANGGHVLLGVDAPIGVPIAYARRHVQELSFPAFLQSLAESDSFFDVCPTIEEVAGSRPFFPQNTGGSPRRNEHAARLGVPGPDALLRRCDKAEGRRPAASLFWTLGANQVGKAALALWRELLRPGLGSDDPPALWPFDGDLHPLLHSRSLTIAETYPAEALSRLKPKWLGSKRRQADRAGLASTLLTAMEEFRIELDADLHHDIQDGFGSLPTGEDRFDSFLGVLAMLKVVTRPGDDVAPQDEMVRKWEGWIMGQLPDNGVASF